VAIGLLLLGTVFFVEHCGVRNLYVTFSLMAISNNEPLQQGVWPLVWG